MENMELTVIDKSSWPRGPWDSEPDKVQWTDPATGLPCLAVRNPRSGNWCGYVGVSSGHPAYHQGYDAVDVEVHGGLTFAGSCQENSPEPRICHTPEPGEPDDVWWLGFDCAHVFDLSPAYKALLAPITGDVYRSLGYVRWECTSLAQQLSEIGPEDVQQEPDQNDEVRCCPDCERPNQFGELCPECTRDRDVRDNVRDVEDYS